MLLGFGALVTAGGIVAPLGLGYVATHVMRQSVPAAKLGAAHEDVSFTTSDGLELQGWYVPSKNGAAVIAFPGRSGPQAHTRMLARHGYGVLLFDRRGEGASEGDSNLFGWGGDKDILAAIEYLKTRPDVEPGRIGGIGFSVGGELMLQTAAETDDLAAVVSEGAGTRKFGETMEEFDGLEKWIQATGSLFSTVGTAVFSSTMPPPKLTDLAPKIEQPLFVIWAPNGGNVEHMSTRLLRARARPEADLGHADGQACARHLRPAEGVRAARSWVLRPCAPRLSSVSSLPTGTVTFLFADVEGSTRLARELGEGWQRVLADIRRLLREAVAKSDGHVVDARGDELFAVFTTPSEGAVAATDAQRLLGGHTWPTPVRVRIGLHTGTAAIDEDGYVGVDVHRAFRIASAGHGGQIVTSEACAAELTPERELRDLGLWSLPELPEPERIFQLEEPGLGGSFPRSVLVPAARLSASCSPRTRCCSAKALRGCSRTPASTSSPNPGTPKT